MEASALRPNTPRDAAPIGTRASNGERFFRNLTDPVRSGLQEAGAIGAFTGRTFAELFGVWRYTAEILRQAGTLIVGSAAIICFMQLLVGVMCATEANYVLRGYGATIYSGIFTSWCANREMGPYMWGYILAAKVGCGLVAEIGSMRINEELDAMEAQGINPMRYVVCTRLVAAWITLPLIFIIGMACHHLANYFVIVVQIGEVSQGGWELIHWTADHPLDLFVFAEIKIMVMATAIVIVGMYYGYHASGGPTGVGTATARSMILNLILIHIIGALFTMIFWGLSPRLPVGG